MVSLMAWFWGQFLSATLMICRSQQHHLFTCTQITPKFGLWEGVPVSHPHAKFHHCELKNVGLQPPKSPKLVFLVYICPKGVYPLKRFLQSLAWWRESQVRIVIPNFTVLALKMWAYSRKNRENFAYKFAIVSKFWGSTEKVKYRCTNLPACNDTITVLIIILLHSVSVITNFVIPKRDKQTNRQKNHTFSFTAGAQPAIPTILGMVIEEVRTIFAPRNFFDLISNFAAKGD